MIVHDREHGHGAPEPGSAAGAQRRPVGAHPARPGDLAALQRLAGNAAVCSLVVQRGGDEKSEGGPKEKALQRHRQRWESVRDLLRAALTTEAHDEWDRRWINTARFVLEGVCTAYVLTAPHDQDRWRERGGPRWVMSALSQEEPADDYGAAPSSSRNLYEHNGAVPAFALNNALYLHCDTERTPETIRTFLVHEVQHIADWTSSVDPYRPFEAARRGETSVLEAGWSEYVTEYRAHYYQGRTDFPPPGRSVPAEADADEQAARIRTRGPGRETDRISESDRLAFTDERQYRIFLAILGSSTYAEFNKAWDVEQNRLRHPFREMIAARVSPHSLNPLNSPTLHRFYASVHQSLSTGLAQFTAAFEALDETDLHQLSAALDMYPRRGSNPGLAHRIDDFIRRRAGSEPTTIRELIAGRHRPAGSADEGKGKERAP